MLDARTSHGAFRGWGDLISPAKGEAEAGEAVSVEGARREQGAQQHRRGAVSGWPSWLPYTSFVTLHHYASTATSGTHPFRQETGQLLAR